MPISDAKLAANRANALHSTGPTTDHGKATSSQNATTHGLTGGPVVLPTEDITEFQFFSTAIIESLAPENALEREFAEIVAQAQWRLKRIRPIEEGLLNVDSLGKQDPSSQICLATDPSIVARAFMDRGRSLANLSHYEHRLYRQMTHALKQFQTMKTDREAREQTAREKAHAEEIRRYYCEDFGRPVQPPSDPVADPQNDIVDEEVLAVTRVTGQACALPAALSPEHSDQRREVGVSGFVSPKNATSCEIDEFPSLDLAGPPDEVDLPGDFNEKEAA
jgi:hypothetical protein